MAEISVVVPVYKVEQFLDRCVESIIKQTYTDYDLILVDDGSPDRCGEICEAYAKSDSRIHVIHQKNKGLSAARNTGIDWAFQQSNSRWLTFIDSDDWIHPQYLEALLDAADLYKTAVSIGDALWTQNSPLPETIQTKSELWKTEEYYSRFTVNANVTWGKLYKKECFEKIRFPEGKIHEDEYVTYRVLFRYEYVAIVAQPLYAYYQNPDGIMKGIWTPRHLDAINGLEEQVAFFLELGKERIAKERFLALTEHLIQYQERIRECPGLNKHEKRHYAGIVMKHLRKNAFGYRKYNWLPIRNYKYVYAEMFSATSKLRAFKKKVCAKEEKP